MKNSTLAFQRTPCLVEFKKIAGNANRNLNIACIAVETLKSNEPVFPDDLILATQLPTSPEQWEENRDYLMISALVLFTEAAKRYLKNLGRMRNLLPDQLRQQVTGAISAQDSGTASLESRYRLLCEHFRLSTQEPYLDAVAIISLWRNGVVHGLKPREPAPSLLSSIERGRDFIATEHAEAELSSMLYDYCNQRIPKLKQLSTLFSCVHNLINEIDAHVLDSCSYDQCIEDYLIWVLESSGDKQKKIENIWKKGGAPSQGTLLSEMLHIGLIRSADYRTGAPTMTTQEFLASAPTGMNEVKKRYL